MENDKIAALEAAWNEAERPRQMRPLYNYKEYPAVTPQEAILMSNYGIKLLKARAYRDFSRATGIWISHQLTWRDDWCDCADGCTKCVPYAWRSITMAGHERELEEAARFAGWLKATSTLQRWAEVKYADQRNIPLKYYQYPAVLKLINAGTLGRALNSPYERYTPEWLFEHWPSPGQLEKTAWKVRARASEILRAYGFPMEPMWVHTGMILLSGGHRNIGRMAKRLAAMTLSLPKTAWTTYDQRPTYHEALDILIRLRPSQFPVQIDEHTFRQEAPLADNGSVAIYRALVKRPTYWLTSLIALASNGERMALWEEHHVEWLLENEEHDKALECVTPILRGGEDAHEFAVATEAAYTPEEEGSAKFWRVAIQARENLRDAHLILDEGRWYLVGDTGALGRGLRPFVDLIRSPSGASYQIA